MSTLVLEPRLGDASQRADERAVEEQLTLDVQLGSEGPAAAASSGGAVLAPGANDRIEGEAGVGGESSLDALLSRMWEGLAAHQAAECPLCAGEMVPVYGAHPLPIGARCARCETTLR